jgi:hypothetical protein
VPELVGGDPEGDHPVLRAVLGAPDRDASLEVVDRGLAEPAGAAVAERRERSPGELSRAPDEDDHPVVLAHPVQRHRVAALVELRGNPRG